MTRYFLIILLLPFLLDAQTIFISGDIETCSNLQEKNVKISFRDGVAPYSFVYAIDGVDQENITTDDNPYYLSVKQSGIYTVTYFSDAISNGNIIGAAEVNILEAPTALFSTDADTLSILYKNIKIQDISDGNIVAWQWDFGDGNTSSIAHPYHSYEEAPLGVYEISLIVTDDVGCMDTTVKKIYINDHYWMYIPNTFTPNNDNLNDKFCIEYNGIRENTFIFNIFNPLGDLVYQSRNPDELRCSNNGGWDGRNYLTENESPETNPIFVKNSYTYTVYFQDFQGWKHNEQGYITLIR